MDSINHELHPFLQTEQYLQLEEWSRDFWQSYSEQISFSSSQRGFEDKGYGHIEKIIANAADLISCYCQQALNPSVQKIPDELRLNILLFSIVAHLHDMGMAFPSIFKSLAEIGSGNAHSAIHLSEIIHDYHHYASFIVLLEITHLSIDPKDIYDPCDYPYFGNIPSNEFQNIFPQIQALKVSLTKLHEELFREIFEITDYFVILAILCLPHKEVNMDYLGGVIGAFQKRYPALISSFHEWWNRISRAMDWTVRAEQKIAQAPRRLMNEEYRNLDERVGICSSSEAFGLKCNNDSQLPSLDLLLVEALLQYGDKTDITSARLARTPELLKEFIARTEYDGMTGGICVNVAQRVVSNFARFRACRFLPVLLVTVQPDTNGENIRSGYDHKMQIIIHYQHYRHDDEIFKLIRYHNEKDFYDLRFLQVIKIHLPIILEKCLQEQTEVHLIDIGFKRADHSFSDEILLGLHSGDAINENNVESNLADASSHQSHMILMKLDNMTKQALYLIAKRIAEDRNRHVSMQDMFPYTPRNRVAIRQFSPTAIGRNSEEHGAKQVFYETPDMLIPYNFEALAILNLFRS
jgi:hypothetical protein